MSTSDSGRGHAAMPSDGRRAARRRVLKAGIIAFNDRHSTLSCSVRDLSDTGAHLRLVGSVGAPDTFDLIIDLDGFEARCRVMWRRGDDIGVVFEGVPRLTAPKRVQTISPVVPQPRPSLRRKRD